MEIITVETSTDPKHTKRLIETWQQYGIVGTTIGKGVTWNGFGTKLGILRDFINTCQDDIILFTDARDVVFAAGYDEILDTFLSMNVNILFGAETNLYPNKSLVHGNDSDKYRYLNSGLFMGYTESLRKLFNTIQVEHERDDQEALQKKFIEGFPITLDSQCKIFQNLWDETGGRSCNFDLLYQPTYIENLRTNTRPKIFHAPGPTTVLSQAYKVAMRLY